MGMRYTIGLDYGTNSARALVVDCADGREIGTAVVGYPSGQQCYWMRPLIISRGKIRRITYGC